MDDVEVVRRFLRAMRRRRPITMLRLASPDMVLSLPGESPRVGPRESRGPAQLVRTVGRIMRASRGTLKVEPHSFAQEAGRVIVPVRATAKRGAERLDLELTFSFLVRDGKVAELRESTDDLEAWHAFWD
jgi:ketosteroid isomerase-like protein